MKSLSKKFNINLFIILKDLKKYNLNYFRKDIFAALSVALLAIPQAIAYSLLAGLPPMAGVYAAIFGTIFTGAFASSRYLVSGMSIGISILIQTSIADILANYYPNVVGLEKEQIVITILMQLVLFMGVFQIIFSLFNFGKLLQFVSRSVILGYFVGVAIAILVNQLFPFLGILDNSKNSLVCIKAFYLISHIFEMKFLIFAIGTLSLGIILFLKYFYKKIPYALISLVLITLIVYFLNNYGFNIGVLENLSFKSSFILDFSLPTIDFKIL